MKKTKKTPAKKAPKRKAKPRKSEIQEQTPNLASMVPDPIVLDFLRLSEVLSEREAEIAVLKGEIQTIKAEAAQLKGLVQLYFKDSCSLAECSFFLPIKNFFSNIKSRVIRFFN